MNFRDFLLNGKKITESEFSLLFPENDKIAFIDFDKLKTKFSSFHKINNTPLSCDFVCLGLSQKRCEFIEAKNLTNSYVKINKILPKLEKTLPKKFSHTLIILSAIINNSLLFKCIWDKGILYFILVAEDKTPQIIKYAEFIELTISKSLKSSGLNVNVYCRSLKEIQRYLDKIK